MQYVIYDDVGMRGTTFWMVEWAQQLLDATD